MKKLFLLLLIPLVALGWIAWRRNTDAPEVPFAKVKRETLVSTLPTNGKVEPIEWQAVRAENAGLVATVPVQEGQIVGRGAVLAKLTDTGLQAELSSAQARVEEARAGLTTIEAGGRASQLTEIENNLARARFEQQAAAREYESLRRLVEKQAATRVEMLAAQGRLKEAELQIEALGRQRASLIANSDKAVALAKLKDAEAAVSLAQSRIAETVIRSPIAGTVYNLAARAGSYLDTGDLVANVGRVDRIRVRVYVDEPELGRVAVGQPVIITWDALPDKQWDGTVERKPAAVVALGSRQVGEVLVTIGNPGRELVPGTNVNAEIRTSVVPNALAIPKEALRRRPSGPGVFALNGETLQWRSVTTGTSSITQVQITSGLSEGDSIVLPTERTLQDGQRVSPVYP
ncbi:MAG: efflux RND transporter periplasmic adaptor subunit [Acidobacteria bacterium]|nr:efflux RND transporter periplasmic adaptor subunit [Acidobacteriota bacterium]